MSLTPKNAIHEKQIKAGISGRKKGHKFEAILTDAINNLQDKVFYPTQNVDHIFHGNPATQLLQYISIAIQKKYKAVDKGGKIEA